MEGSKLSSGAQQSQQTESTPPRPASSLRAGAIIAILLIAFAALFFYGYNRYQRRQAAVTEASRSAESTLPLVSVEPVRKASATTELILPGNITPITEAYIYARAAGYVRHRHADIGDRVIKGQLLADIEAPELDQQVQQARAAYAQTQKQLEQARADSGDARARMELAQVTWNRYKVLVEHGAVSRQEGDQQLANFRSASAAISSVEARVGSADQNVQAGKSNLDRLLALQEFEKVRAPFGGVITTRNFDIGALISGSGASMGQSGGSSAAATGAQGGELFRIAQIEVLRVLISVPETDAPAMRAGSPAVVLPQAFPKREFAGRITRTANAVDMTSRTMLTEVQVRNPDLVLMPGMFVKVRLLRERKEPPLLIAGDSIITTGKGLQVAVLQEVERQGGAEGPVRSYPPNARRIHLQAIQVGRDFGQEVEVISGLQGWEHVVTNPGDQIEEGAVVLPVASARSQKARRAPIE